ncbi:MAG: hypothetical protein KAR13_15425 [Desulfobulbaceae bacterium]|nr:hypothetical protein [Desulfobulbaceae bacterium]MCK5544466.1 hypothetical protein [Desulfobulbaceae bacterium]
MLKWFDRQEWFNLAILLFLLTSAILPGIWFVFYGKLPDFWLREDGMYESMATIACVVGGFVFFWSFYCSDNGGRAKRNPWLFLFAIALLVLAGEEISWGQRFFGFDIPADLASMNFQNEFNLHNSKLIQSSNNALSTLLTRLLVVYLIILPLALASFHSVEKMFARMRIPVPSLLIALAALLAQMANHVNYKIIYGSQFSRDYLHIGEGFESILEVCLLLVALECLIKKNLS